MDKRQKKHKQNKNAQQQQAAASKPTMAAAATTVTTTAQTKRPTLTLQKRNELCSLLQNLLESSLRAPANAKEEWQQYVDMQTMLNRVIELESVLRRPAENATAEARLAKIEAFYKWAKAHGATYDGLKIAQFPGFDLGLEATRDIIKDEELFTIPRKLILSEENLDTNVRQAEFGSLTNLKLAYTLLLESLKPYSFWKPYIDLLPEQYNTVLYFSIEQMEQLRGSNALSQALRQCKAIVRQYVFIYNYTQAPRSEKMTSVGLMFKEQFSYDLYRWAISTVMTRQNMIPRRTKSKKNHSAAELPEMVAALIPFWDMANHQHGTVTSFYNAETHTMESTAQMDFKKGEQIFIHYGDRSNADLMVHNGFINPKNPKDSVSIKLGLNAADPLYEKRSELLKLLKIPTNSELKVLSAPDFISAELLAFVRVFNMNAEQLEHWITSERAMDLLHIDCALETSLETKTWQYLQTRLMLLLRVFPTTLEADQLQLEEHNKGQQQLSNITSMIVEYRVLEKRILAEALDYAKQRTKA